MKKLFNLFVLFVCCLGSVSVQAHPLGEVVQESTVMNEGTRLLIVYDTSIGPSITATLIPDADHDGKVSGAEERSLSQDIHKLLAPNLEIFLDNKKVVPELYYASVSPSPGGYNNGLRSNLVYTVPLPKEDFGKHYLKFSDNNFQTGELKWLKWKVQADPQFSVVRTSPDSRELNYQFFTRKIDGAAASFSVPDAGGNNGIRPTPRENASQATLKDYLAQENLGPGTILFALGLAFFLGMGHALSPGHGKAMVAAYLIGRNGRIRDAFTLGTIVTITHVASVIVLGIAALLLSRYFLPGDLYPWLGAFSGALVFAVGYMMLARRAVHHHGHTHDHSHSRSHSHNHDGEDDSDPVSWWSMLSLGVAGGMVPCPTALVVLLASVAFGRIVFGLLLIFSFSFGLAAVLILIGILTVRASKLTERFSGSRRWIENLPVLSAGLVMLAGIAIALNALYAGGIIKFTF